MTNPLSKFFRKPKIYVSLPTGSEYYSEEVVKFDANGELGVCSMTGGDEIALKNPDALLNGDAMIQVIKSCVQGVKDPTKLVSNDIDVLISAIRYATYGDDVEVSLKCPECKEQSNFKIDVQHLLHSITFLDKEYVINDGAINLFIRPYTFVEAISGLQAQFEQSKLAKALVNKDLGDSDRTKIMTEAFARISILNHKLLTNAVEKIVITDESSETVVTEEEHIAEYLKNAESMLISRIEDIVKQIASTGVAKEKEVECPHCSHTWETTVDFNPVNFS